MIEEPMLVMFRPGYKERFIKLEKGETTDGFTDYCGIYSPNDLGLHHYYFSLLINHNRHYIKKNGADDIMLSFTFGPALVETGVPYDPAVEKNYPLGESYMHSGRAAIGQLGKLHYLLCTYGNPGLHREDFPAIMAEKGCITAYNLDGGQSGTLVFQNKVFNKIAYMGEQRPMSDVLYFASAE